MPLYEYRCSACHHQFELLLPMSQSDSVPGCPQCSSAETSKLLSLFACHSEGGKSPAGSTGDGPSAPASSPGGHTHGGCGCGKPS